MKLWAISSFDARKIGQGTRLKIKINYYIVLFSPVRKPSAESICTMTMKFDINSIWYLPLA
jgi:hypothetical protein